MKDWQRCARLHNSTGTVTLCKWSLGGRGGIGLAPKSFCAEAVVMCCDFYGLTSEETAESENAVTFPNATSPHRFILHFKPHLEEELGVGGGGGVFFSNHSPSIITQ